jgi:hypothetical protein
MAAARGDLATLPFVLPHLRDTDARVTRLAATRGCIAR